MTCTLLYGTLDYMAAQQTASPGVLDVLTTLADKICLDHDTNDAIAYVLTVSDANLPPPDKALAVAAAGVFRDAVAEWAQAEGIDPNASGLDAGILRHGLHDTLTWIIGDVAGSVIEHLSQTLIDARLDPCRLCPSQCCPGPCDASVPFDFNSDGVTDTNDLADLTALWLAGL